MSHDFAKKREAQSKPAKPKKKAAGSKSSAGWLWFFSGFIFGVFVCGLAYLSGVAPKPQDFDDSSAFHAGAGTDAKGDPESSKPRFDFYTLLPEQKIGLPDARSSGPQQQSTPINYYLLQAGSFRRLEDADRRRAELILLGMNPTISDTNVTSGRWFRVQVGPFETRSKLAKARGILANKGIDTLLLKRAN